MTVLKVSGLTKNFGGLAAVSNVNLEIEERELIGLIGPNGAGKTTLFNLLTGVYDPSEGKIELNVDGTMKSIGGLKPYVITGLGLARTFQNIRLFKNMTVLDNVKLAMNKSVNYSTLAAILRLPSYYREEQRVLEEAVKLLEVVGLAEKQTTLAKNLPYGQQRKLEIVGVKGEKRTPEQMEEILKERKAKWQPKPPKYTKGTLKLFSEHAVSPIKGGYMV